MSGLVIPTIGAAPTRQHRGDAGADLTAAEGVVLHSGQRAKVPLGVKVAIPVGHAGLIVPRSGLAAKHGITIVNAPGLIDSGFRGELAAVLVNHGAKPYVVRAGDRVAQLVIIPVVTATFEPVEALDLTDRGEDGFGSTGVAS